MPKQSQQKDIDVQTRAVAALVVEFLTYSTVSQRYKLIRDHPELLEPQSEKIFHWAIYDSGQVPRRDHDKVWKYLTSMLAECRQYSAAMLLSQELLRQAWKDGTESLRVAIKNAMDPTVQDTNAPPDPLHRDLIKRWEELAFHPDITQFPETRAFLLRQNAEAYMSLFQSIGDPQLAYHACESIVALGAERTKKDSYERCLYFSLAATKEHFNTARIEPLDKAIDECLQLLSQFDENAREFAYLHSNIGELYIERSRQSGSSADLETAIKHLMLTVKAISRTGTQGIIAVTALSNLGFAQSELFRRTQNVEALESGINTLRQAVTMAEPQSVEKCDAQSKLALALKMKFSKTHHIPLIKEALDLLESCASPSNLGYEIDGAVRLDNLGTTLREYWEDLYFTGAGDESLDVLNRCIEIQKQALALVEQGKGPKGYLYGFLSNLGIALKNRNAVIPNDDDLNGAVQYLERALPLIAPEAAFRCSLLNNLAMCRYSLYFKTKDLSFLDKAIEDMQESAEHILAGSTEQIEYMLRLGTFKSIRFQHTQKLSDLDDSLATLDEAWNTAQKTHNWSVLAYKLGQQSQNQPINELLIELNLVKAKLSPNTAESAWKRALEVNESSKAKILLSMLNQQDLQAPDDVAADLVEEEHRCLLAVANFDREQLQAADVAESAATSLARLERLNQRRAAIDRLNEVWDKMASQGPRASDYVAMRRGYGVTWDSIAAFSKQGGEETALISLYCSDEAIIVFVVKAGQAAPAVVRVPMTRLELYEFVKNFYAEVMNWHSNRAEHKPVTRQWQQLGISIFTPVMRFLEGIKHITISAQGALHYLPLHALFIDDAQRCLLDNFSVSYTPALGPLFSLSSKKPIESTDSLVVGYTPNLIERPLFIGEAESVAEITHGKLVVNMAATAASLQRYSKQPLKAMHFSCHGAFARESPLNSAILLADGGFTMRSWLNLQLEADLVTLSACQLAQSANLGGEEMMGFVQGILISGGRSALLGLWNVNALITKALMERFYNNWFNKDIKMTKAQALRQAVLDLRKSPPPEALANEHIDLDDPYLWAPFCLYGVWS